RFDERVPAAAAIDRDDGTDRNVPRDQQAAHSCAALPRARREHHYPARPESHVTPSTTTPLNPPRPSIPSGLGKPVSRLSRISTSPDTPLPGTPPVGA